MITFISSSSIYTTHFMTSTDYCLFISFHKRLFEHFMLIWLLLVKEVPKLGKVFIRYIWFKYDLGQKYHTPQVRPDQGSNSWPSDHDSTFHVTETPALTTGASVTSLRTNIVSAWKLTSSWLLQHLCYYFTSTFVIHYLRKSFSNTALF